MLGFLTDHLTLVLLLLCLALAALPCGMINLGTETLLTLAQLAKRLPRRRRNRPVHPSTVFRWRFPGIRGVRLECVRIGGAWHTSWQAFERFCAQLSEERPLLTSSPSSAGRAKDTSGADKPTRSRTVVQCLASQQPDGSAAAASPPSVEHQNQADIAEAKLTELGF